MATKNNINSLYNKLRKNINCNIKLELQKPIIEEPNTNDIGEQSACYRKQKRTNSNTTC